MITSCHAAEGKSFLSMNIMRMFAKFGKTVVLIDADMRRSMISARYMLDYDSAEEKWGLSHMLAGMVTEEQVLYQTNIAGAYMVPVDVKCPILSAFERSTLCAAAGPSCAAGRLCDCGRAAGRPGD